MISMISLILAALAKACMDISADGKVFVWGGNPFYFSKALGSTRKYKQPQYDTVHIKGSDITVEKHKNEEAFFGSTTIFVWLTDFWHLTQMVFLTCMFSAVVLYKPIVTPVLDFVIMRVTFGVVFEVFYSKILVRRK